MSDDSVSRDSGWRLDKRIPVTLLVAIFIQSMAVFLWAAHLDGRVSNLESTTVSTEKFAHLDEKMNSVKDDMNSLKQDIGSVKDEIRRLAIHGK